MNRSVVGMMVITGVWSVLYSYGALVHVGSRILDLKTGTVKKEGQQSSMRMCMGSRRSFICRMRNGLGPVKEGEAQYAVVHCTGYIKAWPPAGRQYHTRSATILVRLGHRILVDEPEEGCWGPRCSR
ncbi:hypothetical protein CB1_001254014 [Camelus ferus]|nr:hypothetical protein CB1_001254014 [Camelus ferus]